VALICFAGLQFWESVRLTETMPLATRFSSILECVGLLTIAVAALELGQTIHEEELLRQTRISAPSRARRFLSRFLVVIVVALAIETLVAVFQFVHKAPTQLPYAAWIGFTAATLLLAWGVFVKLNRSVEELEPESLAQTKQEDRDVP
jgi:hypothetical protein